MPVKGSGSMKIVVLDGYAVFPGDIDDKALYELGEVEFYDRTPAQLTVERIGDAQIVLTNKTLITRAVMEACPQLRYIGVLATGYNVVDAEAAKEKGIIVTNVPAYSTQSVAQHTIAMLLESTNHIAEYDARVKRGDWTTGPDFCLLSTPTEELDGKTMGLSGFGRIAQAVARIALALGMRVIVHTRTVREGFADVEFVDRDELFARSDVISLHCPLTSETQGMISAEAIALMKPGVRVINTARGPLVDEAAMAAALESGSVACYMADILSVEPPPAENLLLNAPDTILTPHVAWAPHQARERLRDIAAANVRAYLSGTPRNVVNP